MYDNRYKIKSVVDHHLGKINDGNKTNTKFVSSVSQKISKSRHKYLDIIKKLDPEIVELGTFWLQQVIEKTVEASLVKHIALIKAEPELLTRAQVAKQLRITQPTLRKLELDGKLIPERAGRRVLYNARKVQIFLNT